MTHKIFYNPKTLKIVGMSDGDSSMEFPFIETLEEYHSTDGLEIKIVKDKAELKIKKISLKDKIKKEQGYINLRQKRKQSIDAAKKELKNAKLTTDEVRKILLHII